MNDYSKITALYSRLSVGDEDRDGGESNSIQNQKKFLESYARQLKLTNIRHYIDDDESGRFFDRSAYSRMIEDVENGKIGVCIMKDMTRWGRDYLQVGNAMEIFRRNNVRFIAVNNGIDSEKPDTLEFAPFINIMSEWYAKDISKKVKTGIKTKGMSGKPIATEALYGYVKCPDNKDFWIIDEEAAGVVRLIFRLFLDGKNRNQIAVYLTQAQIPTPTFYMKERGRGTCKNRALNEANRYKWNKATLTHILTRQEYCGDVVNFKTTKHFRDGLHEQIRVNDVRGIAFGVFGFSLVVLAAIGNMTLAAIPIIYANVHFRTAILTEKQARQRVDFPVPVGAFDGRIFQNPLYGFKVGAVNNRLMHIFGYLPLAPVYIVVPLVPEMLCSLEVDRKSTRLNSSHELKSRMPSSA